MLPNVDTFVTADRTGLAVCAPAAGFSLLSLAARPQVRKEETAPEMGERFLDRYSWWQVQDTARTTLVVVEKDLMATAGGFRTSHVQVLFVGDSNRERLPIEHFWALVDTGQLRVLPARNSQPEPPQKLSVADYQGRAVDLYSWWQKVDGTSVPFVVIAKEKASFDPGRCSRIQVLLVGDMIPQARSVANLWKACLAGQIECITYR